MARLPNLEAMTRSRQDRKVLRCDGWLVLGEPAPAAGRSSDSSGSSSFPRRLFPERELLRESFRVLRYSENEERCPLAIRKPGGFYTIGVETVAHGAHLSWEILGVQRHLN